METFQISKSWKYIERTLIVLTVLAVMWNWYDLRSFVLGDKALAEAALKISNFSGGLSLFGVFVAAPIFMRKIESSKSTVAFWANTILYIILLVSIAFILWVLPFIFAAF